YLYLASMRASTGTLYSFLLSGTPAAGNVQLYTYNSAISGVSLPPYAVQPGGLIDTGDTRAQGAVWRNGFLWTYGNTSCVPARDTTNRSCLYLYQLSTQTLSVQQSIF